MAVNLKEIQLTGELNGTDEPDTFVATSGGIVDASIDGLAEGDLIEGIGVNNITEPDGLLKGVGIAESTIKGGEGVDIVFGGTAFPVDPVSPVGILDSIIDLGDGDDDLTGTAANSIQPVDAIGIAGSTINGEEGNDNITGVSTFSAQTVAIFQSTINGGTGDDNIIGTADGGAKNEGIAESTINGGEGQDLILAIAGTTEDIAAFEVPDIIVTPDSSQEPAETNGVGILDSIINGGDDDDTIIARGETIGVSKVEINGDEGDDIFDLQSGTGTVVGGAGNDLLILEGTKEDYNFSAIETVELGVNITRDDVTNFNVSEVEQFQFAGDPDNIFSYDDLFI